MWSSYWQWKELQDQAKAILHLSCINLLAMGEDVFACAVQTEKPRGTAGHVDADMLTV